MRESQRRLLTELRQALIPLHRTLLEWERAAYERVHGRMGAAEILKVIVSDPQFAWLRPVSELIARIDEVHPSRCHPWIASQPFRQAREVERQSAVVEVVRPLDDLVNRMPDDGEHGPILAAAVCLSSRASRRGTEEGRRRPRAV